MYVGRPVSGSAVDEAPAELANQESPPISPPLARPVVALEGPDQKPRRGVLDGAFAILEALAREDDGLGLTALARASGLAKTSAYRLTEQLVTLGAVQRVDNRYYIGPRIWRLGQRWQPDPVLRHAALGPVHSLAVRSRAVASLRILHEDRLRLVCATVPHGQEMPHPADRESAARTATGRVLYATQTNSPALLPDCWSPPQWRHIRESISALHTSVVDHEEAFPGISCVSAPVWWPDGTCAGAVTATWQTARSMPRVRDLVVRAARCIGTGLR
jgi:DNA-binding IclR family transcriptional regulator